MSQASKLLGAAGWKRQGNVLVNDKGERLTLEYLVDDESFIRIVSPWVENMRAIGIDASIRQVDSAQYAARQADFDFDLIVDGAFVHGDADPRRDRRAVPFARRDDVGLRNLPGTADPAVDALIDAVGAADNREKLTIAMRALDRVLRARMDWIPSWYSANHTAAFWDMFGFKEPKPDYGFPVEALWWFDEDKAKAIGKG